MRSFVWAPLPRLRGFTAAAAICFAATTPVLAQDFGTITGTVTRAGEGTAIAGVTVFVREVNASSVTGPNGRYTLTRIPAGTATVHFRWPGFQPREAQVEVVAGQTATLDVALESAPVPLGEIIVQGASRAPERVVEAPAAVSVVEAEALEDASVTGQVGVALAAVPGVDITQSGMNDFNVNARGFNSTLNRRILVLQDGRDLSIAFLGAQEWNGLAQPLEDLERIEMVRGPGSALYGANAFSGVLNITTPAARQVRGTKLTLGAGELESFRADLRHAGVLGQGRWGYRVNGGYSTSDTYSRSRTNPGSLADEYADATDEQVNAPSPGFELRPLNGQSTTAPGQAATGERDPVKSIFGSGRVDYYATGGSVITAEGGASRVENEVFVTGIGRVQVSKALKPYARLGWAADRFNVMAWYTGRDTKDPQYSLASGAELLEESGIYHIEGQTNWPFLADRGRFVLGASYRKYNVNTSGTLMAPANDDRSDDYYSAYGQLEYKVVPQLRAVVAGRIDDGTLFDNQFSPKAALVFSPNENHSFRASVNRAFQTPNYSEFYLRAAAGAPANFAPLEAGLRASPLGPALAGVPNGELFGGAPGLTSSAVRVFALGNANLDVEKVTGYEIGYKGNIGRRGYVGIDLYRNELTNFVTDLLPGVNPTYGAWTSPPQVPAQFRQALEDAVRQQLLAAGQTTAALGLTRLSGDSTAIVVSYTNEGKVDEQGIELSGGYALTDEFSVGASYSYFEFDVKSQRTGDQLLPNTPEHKATFSLDYRGAQGFDVGINVRLVDGYSWAAGVYNGYVPAAELVNISAGYRINNYVRVHAIATNIFDQQRFQIFGGSVIGRRILGGVTATF
jgi:iron complex outermembrane receptor protein